MPRHPDRLIERLAQPAAARLIAASGTAVVFAGSVEQHGGHLPLGTDAFAAQSIAERVAARLDTVAALARAGGRRPLPPGLAGHALAVPGHAASRCSSTCAAVSPAPVPGGSVGELARGELGHAAAGGRRGAGQARGPGGDGRGARDHPQRCFPARWSSPTPGRWRPRPCWPSTPPWSTWSDATPASDRAAGEAAHALFRRPDVYPVMRDFHDVAETGWYGRPELATPERAEEIAEAVADHVVRQAREIWACAGRPGEEGR